MHARLPEKQTILLLQTYSSAPEAKAELLPGFKKHVLQASALNTYQPEYIDLDLAYL